MLNNDDMWTEVNLSLKPSDHRNQTMTYLASRTANRPDSGSTAMGKGSWSNRYDARGNRIADAEFEYQYNAADRLVAIFDRETKQELMRSVYDGTGKRVKVSEPGGPTMWTMYDGEVPNIERSEDGSIALHVYADGLHIARLTMPGSKDATDDPPEVQYYHSDHLGSPRLMTDQDGDVAWPSVKAASYWAYGGVMEDLAGETEANRWRFTGKPEDETPGHHYFNARYLSESTKYNAPQFMSPDPVLGNVGDPRSWNRYAYCGGNPVNYIDPDGREPNKREAGTIGQILLEIKNLESKLPTEIGRAERLEFFAKFYLEGAIRLNGEVIGRQRRYIYTEEIGWLDLTHFFAAANWASKIDDSEIVRLGGVYVELVDQWGDPSSFSYEDLPSNKAGANFGDRPWLSFLDGIGLYNTTILSEFTEFLFDQNPTAPSAAPNWESLPEVWRHINPPGEKRYHSND